MPSASLFAFQTLSVEVLEGEEGRPYVLKADLLLPSFFLGVIEGEWGRVERARACQYRKVTMQDEKAEGNAGK